MDFSWTFHNRFAQLCEPRGCGSKPGSSPRFARTPPRKLGATRAQSKHRYSLRVYIFRENSRFSILVYILSVINNFSMKPFKLFFQCFSESLELFVLQDQSANGTRYCVRNCVLCRSVFRSLPQKVLRRGSAVLSAPCAVGVCVAGVPAAGMESKL